MAEIMIALLLPPVLMLLWALVQNAWRRQFGQASDTDVLAARGNCDSCSCTQPCERVD